MTCLLADAITGINPGSLTGLHPAAQVAAILAVPLTIFAFFWGVSR